MINNVGYSRDEICERADIEGPIKSHWHNVLVSTVVTLLNVETMPDYHFSERYYTWIRAGDLRLVISNIQWSSQYYSCNDNPFMNDCCLVPICKNGQNIKDCFYNNWDTYYQQLEKYMRFTKVTMKKLGDDYMMMTYYYNEDL